MSNGQIKIILLLIFFLSHSLFAEMPFLQPFQTKFCEFVSIDVLVPIYKNTAGRKISAAEIDKLKKGIALSREFIWRNSGCKLNLNISYLEIEDYKDKNFFTNSGLLLPEIVEPDLRSQGISDNQYGIIVLIYSPPAGGGDYGGLKILGNSGYSFFRYPCRTAAAYPGEKRDVDYKATWLFTREIQRSLDLICYEGSGVSEMWNGDNPLDFSINSGEHFSYQAEIFRNFKDYLKIKQPWGVVERATDNDGDLFPDHDKRVPVDEFRFGSDSLKADSDNDGLNDLGEFMAGIYRSSNPSAKDSDSDGFLDSVDEYPINNILTAIPRITPQFEESWESWYQICSTLDHSSANFFMDIPLKVKIFINWDEKYLYFGCEMDAPAILHLDIDLLANGWWHGKDNYRLVVDPFTDIFAEIRVMDTTPAARQYRELSGEGYSEMWDDDPKYIKKFGQILDEFSIDLRTKVTSEKYTIKIKIPNNPKIPFQLKPENKIGLRIYFEAPEMATPDSWATVYAQYDFLDFILK